MPICKYKLWIESTFLSTCPSRDGGDCCGWSCRKNQADGISFPDGNYCGMNGYDCKTQDNCFSKDIKVYRFQITGDVDDPGNEEEIQVFVNSGLFWPKAANQCVDNRDGVRGFACFIMLEFYVPIGCGHLQYSFAPALPSRYHCFHTLSSFSNYMNFDPASLGLLWDTRKHDQRTRERGNSGGYQLV